MPREREPIKGDLPPDFLDYVAGIIGMQRVEEDLKRELQEAGHELRTRAIALLTLKPQEGDFNPKLPEAIVDKDTKIIYTSPVTIALNNRPLLDAKERNLSLVVAGKVDKSGIYSGVKLYGRTDTAEEDPKWRTVWTFDPDGTIKEAGGKPIERASGIKPVKETLEFLEASLAPRPENVLEIHRRVPPQSL